MGMHASGAEQSLAALIQLATQLQGLLAAFDTGARQYELSDVSRICAFQYFALFGGEAWVRQVDADVY
jgi:hypothetical protein